jgi:N-carbamoylputrescine amidase
MNDLKIGWIQAILNAPEPENLARLTAEIRLCAAQGAQLIVLPELHNGPYFCQTENPAAFHRSEPIPGPSTAHFSQLARELHTVLVLSLFEKRLPGLYHNTAVVIDADGSIAGLYRKMHIPDDPGYYEKYYFTPGDRGFRPIHTTIGLLGVLICWDQWYPEAARLMALAGAELLIYPTAIGWDPTDTDAERQRQRNAWIISQQAHAIHNGLPLLAVNRVGHEADPSLQTAGICFWGSSFLAGPQGEILYQSSADQEDTHVHTLPLHRSQDVRQAWPFLRDRRIDAYNDLTRRLID